jgi:hypothetical protein
LAGFGEGIVVVVVVVEVMRLVRGVGVFGAALGSWWCDVGSGRVEPWVEVFWFCRFGIGSLPSRGVGMLRYAVLVYMDCSGVGYCRTVPV